MNINHALPLKPATKIVHRGKTLFARENITPVVTPLIREDGRLLPDVKGIGRLVRHLTEIGGTSIFVMGETGEFRFLPSGVRRETIRSFSACAGTRLNVFVNVTGDSEEETLENAAFVAGLRTAAGKAETNVHNNIKGIVAAPIYYIRNNRDIARHAERLNETIKGSGLFLFFYNNPGITRGENVLPETMASIANIVPAIKDSSGDLERIESYSRFVEVGQGDETRIVEALKAGATFSVASMGNVFPFPNRLFEATTLEAMNKFQLRIDEAVIPLTGQRRKIVAGLKYALDLLAICSSLTTDGTAQLTDAEKVKVGGVVRYVFRQ
ncbi:MAG: dihydrodipicolinate synthase family protein [Candidatus Saganbacteria bacterium]|nr:dihydrodipicolinate synthase family protein [Candidatus Saganbacteria bacterium]